MKFGPILDVDRKDSVAKSTSLVQLLRPTIGADVVRRARARVRTEVDRARYAVDCSAGLIAILQSRGQRRHAIRWIRSLQKDYVLTAPLPWLTFDAIDFIDGRLGNTPRVFEYGSGGSTVFWLQRGAHCTSVEHDIDWYRSISERVAGVAGVDYRLVPPEPAGSVFDPADPNSYGTDDASLRHCSFQRYVSQIDDFPDEHFDLVLVDGRSRPACVRHSASKVKRGGMLVVDNTERPYYLAQASAYLRQYAEFSFNGVLPSLLHWTRTSVFVRQDHGFDAYAGPAE